MKSIRIFAVLSLIFLLMSCAGTAYRADQVKVISEGLVNDGIKLTFQPMPETMYFCGGVSYEVKGEKIFFKFNRTPIENTVMCDTMVSRDQNGNSFVIFPFPEGQEAVELIDSSGRSLGKWTKE